MYWFIQASRQQFIFISIFKNALLQTTFNSYYIIFGKEMFYLNLYWVWFNIVLVWFFIKHRFFFSIEIAFSSSLVFDWAWFSKPTATRHSVCLRPGWNTCPCKWPWASLLSGQAPAMQCCFPHLHRENLPQLNFPQM